MITGGVILSGGIGGSSSVARVVYFPILGQSNAEGRGNGGSPVGFGYYMVSGGTPTYPLIDPVGGASTTSMWPAHANQWALTSGIRGVYSEHAAGGSALIAAANPANNWSATGTLRGPALTAMNANIAALQANRRFVLQAVIPIWLQGEQDAAELNAATPGVTAANYITEFNTLLTYFKTNLTFFTRMDIIRIGSKNDRSQYDAWAQIRDAQEDLVAANPADLRMVYRGGSSFSKDALNFMDSASTGTDVHWGQPGLDLAGQCAAIESASISPSAIPTAPAIVGTPQQLTDTNSGAVASPSTTAYTTEATAQGLIVTVGLSRMTSNSTNAISGVTFNGVALTKANKNTSSTLRANAANASPACRVDNDVFYIGNAAYLAATGNNIAGVTANVVITYTASSNTVQGTFISVDSDIIVDTSPALFSAVSGATTALTTYPTPGAAALAVGITGSSGPGAAAYTCTWTGLTEIQDAGASTGTRNGQFSVATGSLAMNTVNTVTATMSAATDAMGLQVACFRKRVSGEGATIS